MKNLTLEKILSAKLPGDLFSSPNNMDREFKELSMLWHPDKHPDNDQVMCKINIIRDLAKKQIELNIWEKTGSKHIKLLDGKSLYINYRLQRDTEFGQVFLCDSNIIYLVNNTCLDLYDNFIKKTNSFKFPSTKIKDDIEKSLPKVSTKFELENKQKIIVVTKNDDLFSLKDIQTYYNENIPIRHVAWILSSLYNLSCYLSYAHIVHNAITLENYFICPRLHSGALLGGWFYACDRDSKMIGMNKEIFSILPFSVKNSKLASHLTDLESIKLIGRTLLGHKGVAKMRFISEDSKKEATPKPMIDFLTSLSSNKSVDEYKSWGQVLKDSFGEKKFVEMSIEKDSFYKELLETH